MDNQDKIRLTNKIKKAIGIKNDEKVELTLINKGYYAKSYLFRTNYKKLFIKEFESEKAFYEELANLKKLSEISVKKIFTPKIISSGEKIIILGYADGTEFYKYLVKNRVRYKQIGESFFSLGKYLAEFHDANFIGFEKGIPIANLHGDMNCKNILFFKNNDIFITDPYFRQASIYKEIARVICNFYTVNIVHSMFISKIKRYLIQSFINGYKSSANFELEEKNLKNAIIDMMNDQKYFMRKDLMYKIKKIFINRYFSLLVKYFDYDKLQIKLH